MSQSLEHVQAAAERAPAPARQSEALPICFGPPAATLFGWYHPAPPANARLGVVLCAPLGVEALMTHRTYRTVAERLAAGGYPSLRFDYHGTGDSAGGDDDADRLRSWLNSIGLAIEELRRRSGVSAVNLFGVRLGASLALLSAAERGDVEGVAAWSTCVIGKSYLREIRALQRMGAAALTPSDAGSTPLLDGDEESGGFRFSRQTVADLAQLDLTALARRPSANVLLLTRERSAAPEQQLAERLRQHGVEVSLKAIAGFDDMMDEPHRATVPADLADVVLGWLSGAPGVGHVASPAFPSERAAPDLTCLSDEAEGIREEAVMFGPHAQLFGILCTPSKSTASMSSSAVVLLNAGGLHHIGPNRMYVHLARRWAKAGFATLRMDVAGLGDSGWMGSLAGRMYSREAVADAAAAIEWLRSERRFRQVVLVGLCSGAYVAFYTSLEIDGVSAQVLMNPETFYFKPGDSLDVRMLRRRSVTRTENWIKLVRGQFSVADLSEALVRKRSAIWRQLRGRVMDRLRPTEMPRLARAFAATLDRGTSTLLIYSGDDPGLDYLRAELGRGLDRLRSRRSFRLEVIDGPDHTFTPLWSQARVSDLVSDFLVQHHQSTPTR